MAKKKKVAQRPTQEQLLAKKKAKEKKELIDLAVAAAALLLVAAAIFALVTWLSQPPVTLETDFTAYDASGKEVKLSDYAGKPIVLNFWASWCGPCKAEMPDFQAAYESYGKDVQFIMVNMTATQNESQEKAEEFLKSAGYTFPILFDLDGDAMDSYGIQAFPTTYFIDADGNVQAHYAHMIDEATLLADIKKIQ